MSASHCAGAKSSSSPRGFSPSSGRLGGSGGARRWRARMGAYPWWFRSRTRADPSGVCSRPARAYWGSRAFACAVLGGWSSRRCFRDASRGRPRGRSRVVRARRASRRTTRRSRLRRARSRSRAVPRGSLGRGGRRRTAPAQYAASLVGNVPSVTHVRVRERVVRPPPPRRAGGCTTTESPTCAPCRAREDGCAPRRRVCPAPRSTRGPEFKASNDPSSKRRHVRGKITVFVLSRARRSDTPRLSPPASTAHGSARARGLGCPPLAAHVSVGPARVPSPARARRVAARTWWRLWRRLVVAPSLGRVASLFASSRSRAGAARTRSPGT